MMMELFFVEVFNGKIGGLMKQVILWCFDYDFDLNLYIFQVMNLMKFGGFVIVVFIVVICVLFWMIWNWVFWSDEVELDEICEVD